MEEMNRSKIIGKNDFKINIFENKLDDFASLIRKYPTVALYF